MQIIVVSSRLTNSRPLSLSTPQLLLGACAPRTAAAPPSGEIADPLEDMNRAIFKANNAVDKVLIKPAAKP